MHNFGITFSGFQQNGKQLILIFMIFFPGLLASTYKARFGNDVSTDTVHASFLIPIDNSRPQINWQLSAYDVLVFDEISMIRCGYFNHILTTINSLSSHPVVIF